MSLTLAFAQVVPANRVTPADEAAKRIADLNRSFAGIAANTPVERELIAACSVDCSRPEVKVGLQEMQARLAAMDSVTTQMHVEVDLYLTRTTDPMNRDLNCRAVQKELARILAPATDTPPSVFLLDSPGSRALIVAYALHKGEQMGRDSTSATVRAYRADKGRVRLIDSVGRDMDDYDSLSFQQLHSPTPSEAWLIARGQATGANGPNVRMRIYAFDGARFRTVWMPANAWGAFSIQVTKRGFSVQESYYRGSLNRHSTYSLAPDGVYFLPNGRF